LFIQLIVIGDTKTVDINFDSNEKAIEKKGVIKASRFLIKKYFFIN